MDWALVAIVIGGLLSLNFALHLIYARICQPYMERLPPFHVPPGYPDNRAERIEFPTTQGLTLRGHLARTDQGPARGVILFCPETLANHWSAAQYCGALRHAGFDVLSFDFRNQGDSDHLAGYDPLHWLTDYEVADVLAALDFVAGRDDLRDMPLGVFGVSRGGCAGLAAAAIRPEVRCVLAQGAYTMAAVTEMFTQRWMQFVLPVARYAIPAWHVRTTLWFSHRFSEARRKCRYAKLERLLPRLVDRPVLLISGGADNYLPTAIPERMIRLMRKSPESLWVVPQAKHNQERAIASDEYDRRIAEFFSVLDDVVVRPAPALHTPKAAMAG